MRSISIVSILILVAIGSGCTDRLDDENEESDEYSIYYIEKSYLINETGYTREGNSTVILQNITAQNIMRISFILTWNDTHTWPPEQETRVWVPYVPQPDTFSLSVKGPNGSEVSFDSNYKLENTSYDGSIKINASLNELPGNRTIFAGSPEDAFNQTMVPDGIGIWEINITCIDAPGTGPGGFVGPGSDMGNHWELHVTIYSYEVNITKI
ncbi:MAG: hypothetical protein KAH57_11430 [Thermoplasmata archaeon]|nr:hypothetical protein [Thermoplasmata archaeon]